ncbi:helix-turn-helix transcriptional regulator [Pinibacter soli]|uniref:Helix-turn-helix transcriptional regulator n=1 Tax=Pinibacter soli TaxID=3044211 RepID=A0ABT6RJ33_9BACT|nr:helix-turn-helix transcriptional regulator [Pinibacter soli]MDI3322582.1 helix-turn-helix transcriptional regulator [Pinibacter soli]
MKVQFTKKEIGRQWLVDLVNDMNTKLSSNISIVNDRVVFPESIASGTCSYHQVGPDVEITIFNLTFNVALTVERLAHTEDNFYCMHINCSPSEVTHVINKKAQKIGGPLNSSLLWCASDTTSSFQLEAGAPFQAIVISMSKEYIQNFLWDDPSSSHSCVLRTPDTETCHLAPEGNHKCDLNSNGSGKCSIDQRYIISRSLKSNIGKLKYELVQEIVNFDKNSSIPEKLFLKGNILKILALFVNRIAQKKERAKGNTRLNDVAKILEIKRIIDNNADAQHLSLAALAKSAAFSKSKLKSKFKEVIGKTTYQYYLDVKMEKARSILQDNTVSITHLAFELGFKSTSHFSQSFKKHFGVSPKFMLEDGLRRTK